MGVILHWFLPPNDYSRSDLSLANAVGAAGRRVLGGGPARAPEIGYVGNFLLNDAYPLNRGQL